MALRTSLLRKTFHFNFKARTSRGLMQDKLSWFIKLWDDSSPKTVGIGECGPLPGLSIEYRPDLEDLLKRFLNEINGMAFEQSTYNTLMARLPEEFPSIRFAFETAWLDLQHGGRRVIFDNTFCKGTPIDINGLIWMGDLDFTMRQVDQKIEAGFNCIKLKVGGLDFEKECDVLHYIRRRFSKSDITIRLDANGAFKTDEALLKLQALEKFNIHSIEQPIKQGLDEMAELCRISPIPVALDEELIGVKANERATLLSRLKPQYIILKPSLHGSFVGTADWITCAERMGIGWWITSALESNIGLNAICQFTANYPVTTPQGLGTGAIYTDNITSPLKVSKGKIVYDESIMWDTTALA
jgi:o-succinylbenzoate synthase